MKTPIENSKRTILLCVAGATPQIITETLWALMEKGERIDEIRVITTTTGRDKCLKLLLDENDGRFHRFLRDFPGFGPIKFGPGSFYILTNKKSGLPSEFDWEDDRLADIVDDSDNTKAANQICEIVRAITGEDQVRVHASVAGGRKTMSIYLMTAMQLFGRKDDELSHVLVSPEVESNPTFYYKTPAPETVFTKDFETGELKPLRKADGSEYTTADARIHLAKIPFIRLRGIGSSLINQGVEDYEDIVRKAQENLESLTLAVDLKRNSVRIGKREIGFEPQQYFVLVLFCYLRIRDRGSAGFVRLEDISLEDFDAVCRLISRARGDELGYRDFDLLRSDSSQKLNAAFFREMNPRKGDDFVSYTLKSTYWPLVSDIKLKFKKAGVGEEYAIINANRWRKNVDAVYGLKIDANRITFS